ncbi:MAG: YdcF family protein [Rhodoferax sp.]
MLSKFVIWLLSPLGTALCLAVLAFVLVLRRRMGAGMTLAALAFVWLWAWSTPVMGLWLRASIEDQFAQVAISSVPKAQALVVLGGAMSPPSGKSSEINLHAAADRVWYAARLFHAGKAPLLVLSGGSEPGAAYSEARAMAIFLADLGVPAQAIVMEERSRTSRDNAAFSATLLKARSIDHILLVTSALHMPRALALFKAQGLQVIPAATDFEGIQTAPPGVQAWLPDALALDGSGRAMKEVVGRWVGW